MNRFLKAVKSNIKIRKNIKKSKQNDLKSSPVFQLLYEVFYYDNHVEQFELAMMPFVGDDHCEEV